MLVGSVPLVVVQMVGALSLVVLCLLDGLHEFGRGCSFESHRGYRPYFPFYGTCTPQVK
jgi:hypothetical protein